MAYIKQISEADAGGLLEKVYSDAVGRAGKVYNILKVQSLNAQSLDAGMRLYLATMHASSPLSRADRELLATVVSRANHCFY
ncbi:MAG TPA: hypothetical protein VGQ81_09855 [Acidobacteriota bacterium]|jgi:alkylhydroperoxidase family enzyme|nr:hypothetical protein [Acidobacteriota bacterium]